MKRLLPVVCLLLLARHVFAWGAQGHEAIAEVARRMLTPAAKISIESILGNDDLASISTWLDDVRNSKKHHIGPLKSDPEAKEFNEKFPTNDQWHYVNLPVGMTLYSPLSPFASPDDIVHAITGAVDVLEGRSDRFTKIQALRVLVHLVGDVHQPFHTIAGYFDVQDPAQAKLITNSLLAKGKPNDRGGNQLFYTKSLEIHALWDTHLVNKLAHAKTAEPLVADIVKTGASVTSLRTLGDYHEWPAKWVGESAAEAVGAYKGLVFGQVTMSPEGEIERIETNPPNSYDEQQLPRVKRQLEKAGVHLAQLLNSIRFK